MVNIVDSFIHSFDKPVMLWLLSRRRRHGYELIREVTKLTGHKLKPSMVYPFLHWLDKEGFATSEWVKNGKRKLRYYSLTMKGKSLLNKMRNFFGKPIREMIMDFLPK